MQGTAYIISRFDGTTLSCPPSCSGVLMLLNPIYAKPDGVLLMCCMRMSCRLDAAGLLRVQTYSTPEQEGTVVDYSFIIQ